MAGLELLNGFLRDLFPGRCPLCGCGQADGEPCERHRWEEAAEREVARCGRCAARLGAGLPHGFRCGACARRPPRFQRAVCLGDYAPGGALREWVLALKHGGRADLAEPLGRALAARWSAEREQRGAARRGRRGKRARGVLLVPVPLHPLRRFERGYDQAWRLARAVADELGQPAARVLRRRRWTEPQGGPGVASRAANVDGAFRATRGAARALRGREAWLVDDVLTSGATLSACAVALRRAGAVRVGVLVLARAGRPPGGARWKSAALEP